MKIQPINIINSNRIQIKSNKNDFMYNPMRENQKELSNFAYKPLSFKGTWFEENYVNKVDDKEYQGKNLYEDGFIDFEKVGWENLSKEPLDLKNATETEFYAFQHANALAETNDTTWVRRYNKFNVTKPLAVPHTLNSQASDKTFAENLSQLLNPKRCFSLDIPITDENGKLNLDCVIFDTETTGINYDNPNKPLDKIIQIGALQMKNGEIVEESAYNQLINPEMSISQGASAVHGITNDMLKDKPTMEQVLKPFVNDYLTKKNGIIVAYNSKFDISMLNNSIEEHNKYSKDYLKKKQPYKVIDPFVLMQRIHPYVGARKKLSEQYKFFFCKNMDNAHDAFADVKGTADILKYSLYYLSKHRVDKSKPLTLREVLIFQNGFETPNIDIKLDTEGCNSAVNFDKSYKFKPVNVINYFEGYKLTKKTLKELEPIIGIDNANKLRKQKVEDKLIDLTSESGLPINPAETKAGGVENAFYVMKNNFEKVIGFAKLEPYQDKSIDDITKIIVENSKSYINYKSKNLWVKNANPIDIKDGNDLPDFEIIKKIANENDLITDELED